MSAKEIFSGTMVFCWLKLALGMAAVLISAFFFVVLVLGIGALLGVGSAVKAAAAAVGLTAACCLAFFLLLRLPLRLMELSGSWSFAAFVLALLAAWAVKDALIDSWVLVKTMPVYLESASKTPLSYDLYGKLCSLSPRFQELLRRGAPPQPAAPQQAYWAQQAYQPQAYYRQPYAQQTVSQAHAQPSAFPVICPVCGNRIEPGKRFCAVCGNQLYPPGA